MLEGEVLILARQSIWPSKQQQVTCSIQTSGVVPQSHKTGRENTREIVALSHNSFPGVLIDCIDSHHPLAQGGSEKYNLDKNIRSLNVIKWVQWEWALNWNKYNLLHTSLKSILWTQEKKILQIFALDFLNHQIKNTQWKHLTDLWQTHASPEPLVSNQSYTNCSPLALNIKILGFCRSVFSEKPICGPHERRKVKFWRTFRSTVWNKYESIWASGSCIF